MTKDEFINQVATRSGLDRRDAAKAVEAILASVTDTLKRGDSVTFTGFGKFSTQVRAARQARFAARDELLNSLGRAESARERLERIAERGAVSSYRLRF